MNTERWKRNVEPIIGETNTLIFAHGQDLSGWGKYDESDEKYQYLKEQGYDVIGVTMQIWQDEETKQIEENGGCCGLSAVDDARRVAEVLGIPYYVLNFKKEFKQHVMDYFVEEYLHGRTPNPCIACNKHLKF